VQLSERRCLPWADFRPATFTFSGHKLLGVTVVVLVGYSHQEPIEWQHYHVLA
jgi:hypothetical protein